MPGRFFRRATRARGRVGRLGVGAAVGHFAAALGLVLAVGHTALAASPNQATSGRAAREDDRQCEEWSQSTTMAHAFTVVATRGSGRFDELVIAAGGIPVAGGRAFGTP